MIKLLSTKGLPQNSLRKQLIDQSAHCLLGVLISLVLLSLCIKPILVLIIVVGIGTSREIIQHKGFHMSSGSLLDILFWGIGSSLALLF